MSKAVNKVKKEDNKILTSENVDETVSQEEKNNSSRRKLKTQVTEIEVATETPQEEDMTIKKKNVLTRESILNDFDFIMDMINTEITALRDGKSTTKPTKFLRNINKQLQTLRGYVSRSIKIKKNVTPRVNNGNSGFQKPVKISKELANFAGWPEDSMKSRVEVTKYICNYIKSNNLENPEDRRQINPDDRLKKLLGYDPKKNNIPLRYYNIQSCLKTQNHFPLEE